MSRTRVSPAAFLATRAFLLLFVVLGSSLPSQTLATSSADRGITQPAVQEQIIRDPEALKALTRAWTLMGGPVWNAAQTIQLTGSLSMYQSKQQAGQFSLSVTHGGDADIVMIDEDGNKDRLNRHHGVLTASKHGKPDKVLPPHKAVNSPSYVPLDMINQAVEDATWSITAGQDSSGPGVEIVIKHVFPIRKDPAQMMSQFTERHLYIDPTSGLPVRIQYSDYSDTNIRLTAPRELDYESYRQFGPYLLPGTITDSMFGRVLNRISLAAAQ